jgi:hypothetical protein
MRRLVFIGAIVCSATAHNAGAQTMAAGAGIFITGTPDKFAAAIVVPDTVPASCSEMSTAMLREGQRGYVLRFGDPTHPLRVASGIWDSTGKLVNYSDGRGDLRGNVPPLDREMRTTISINFEKGGGLLMNESHGKSSGAMTVTADAAMKSERLGIPAILERLHTECGAPQS